MILVTGATGNVGGAVLRQLLDAGERVRAVTRNPATATLPSGADVVGGDLLEPRSLCEAFTGVERVFLFPSPETAAEVVTLAAANGVRRVVLLSSSSVVQGDDNPISRRHSTVEDALRDSGLGTTFVRPGGFATNTLAWAPSIRAESVVRAPFARSSTNLIHEADIAAVAVAALLEDGHDGAAYELNGAGALTQVEQANLIGEAIGRQVRFEELTRQEGLAQLTGRVPEAIAHTILDQRQASIGTTEAPLPGVEQVTGRPPRTFARWAQDHAADFR
ncbi:NAD(P)H-binding protein [Pseudonocardia spinosispora]|uniref:NmrA family NAD(P)-binding protein n=1 Tax=Pseudonocardia spinosispora TaxID=103441 RepID=UPI0003F4C03B|nr:NAD(P)H-binding protein [Pseudonocardia spinosispora]